MKKKYIFLFLVILNYSAIFSQICGTVESFPSAREISNTSYTNCYPINYNKPNSSTYYIKVKFHFLTNDAGNSPTPSPSNISNIINYLNTVFPVHGINIVNNGFDYINNSANNEVIFSSSNIEDHQLSQFIYDDNAINIYVVKNTNAPFAFVSNKSVYIDHSVYLNSFETIAHEIAHCMNLQHTFGFGNCEELIDGSNCLTCGDLVCDTPADNDSGNNNGYNPDMTNIMSYYVSNTRDHFTVGQGYRMKNFIEYNMSEIRTNYTPYLQGCTSSFCVNDFAVYKIIGNSSSLPVIWTKSSNLLITYSTNSTVTVKGISNGPGWVKCEFNGNTFTRNVYIGKPINLTATPYSNGYIINCTPSGYYQMDYVNLITNQTGTTWISTSGNTYTGNNFFYHLGTSSNFKFKLTNFNGCQESSDWLTVTPSSCPLNNYPSNLLYSNFCGSTPGHYCGYSNFKWNLVTSAIKYQVEYAAINLTNTSVPSITGTFQTTSVNTVQPTPYGSSGTWIIKFRVKSQCASGTWSDYSPWSANFAW